MSTTTTEKQPFKRHVLLTRETCNIPHHEERQCPVCEGGLAVCQLCGKYETGLDDPVCKGIPEPAERHEFVEPSERASLYPRGYHRCLRCDTRRDEHELKRDAAVHQKDEATITLTEHKHSCNRC